MKRLKRSKGFTLVEVSVVLVIIGVLIGMVVKGKTLIDNAKAKTEVAQIKSIIMSFYFYVNEGGSKPPRYGANKSFYNMTPLVNSGYFASASDLKSRIGNWYYIPRYLCEYTSGYVDSSIPCNAPDIPSDWLGLVNEVTIGDVTNMNNLEAAGLSWYYLCTISNIVEGKADMGNTGMLRTFENDKPYPTLADFENCNAERPDATFYISIDYALN